MSISKKLIMAAAGGADVTNVEDVFSTYLYKAIGSSGRSQGIPNGIALADGLGGGTSTSFDGTNDYLSKGTTFTNNTNSKTVTISFWFWWDDQLANENERIFGFFGDAAGTGSTSGLASYIDTSADRIHFSHGQSVFVVTSALGSITRRSWNHVLFSIDMDSQSNTKMYINDVAQTLTFSYFSTGTSIKGDTDYNSIGAYWAGAYQQNFRGRLAHFYIDYTWRDLATTSNRRIFIDSNGASTSASSLAANNPIIYFPMTDAYSIGENAGTGGDMTVNGSPTIINNGTEYLSGHGQGGAVWIKARSTTVRHALYDTERGTNKFLITDNNTVEQNDTGGLTAFNADGFTVTNSHTETHSPGEDYASWTFRKTPKFFDIVTYSGNGTASRTISHNLGSTPGMVIVRRTDTSGHWPLYHRGMYSLDPDGAMQLNNSAPSTSFAGGAYFGSGSGNVVPPTDSVFTVSADYNTNASGGTYVAYLFAHNDGDAEFGPTGDQDIIKCGVHTISTTDAEEVVDLGFQAGWVLTKEMDSSNDWSIVDLERGFHRHLRVSHYLRPNLTNAEGNTSGISSHQKGFSLKNTAGRDIIYVAIRSGPMAIPDNADDVFSVTNYTADNTDNRVIQTNNRVDWFLGRARNSTSERGFIAVDRFNNTQNPYLYYLGTDRIDAGATDTDSLSGLDHNYGFEVGNDGTRKLNYSTFDQIAYTWTKAPKFFDLVNYTGTGAVRTIDHNLGVTPEMMWVKARSRTGPWVCYHSAVGNTGALHIDDIGDGVITQSYYWNNTSPTATGFTVADNYRVNQNAAYYTAYLFASLNGVSKVGSYTGDGTNGRTIDCGFSNGASFVLIKDTAANKDWQVYDVKRGIVSGNDPLLVLNNTNAEATSLDTLEPDSSGFQVNNTANYVNESGKTYIFYAIA